MRIRLTPKWQEILRGFDKLAAQQEEVEEAYRRMIEALKEGTDEMQHRRLRKGSEGERLV